MSISKETDVIHEITKILDVYSINGDNKTEEVLKFRARLEEIRTIIKTIETLEVGLSRALAVDSLNETIYNLYSEIFHIVHPVES